MTVASQARAEVRVASPSKNAGYRLLQQKLVLFPGHDDQQTLWFSRKLMAFLVKVPADTNIADLQSSYELSTSPHGALSSLKESRPIKSLKSANENGFITMEMELFKTMDSMYIFFHRKATGAEIDAWNPVVVAQSRVYYFFDTDFRATQNFSIILSWVYVAIALLCLCSGLRQFYSLAKTTQMLSLIVLINSAPKASLFEDYMYGLRRNLLNVIPNPVLVTELGNVESQPPGINFYAYGLSSLSYNTLRDYVLTFLVFVTIMVFVRVSKYSETGLFRRIKRSMNGWMFLIAVFPDVLTAILLNFVGNSQTTAMGLGLVFSFSLLTLYMAYWTRQVTLYWLNPYSIANLIAHHFFLQKKAVVALPLPAIRKMFLSIILEQIKISVFVVMITLFESSPRTQLGVITCLFLFSAGVTMLMRPSQLFIENFLVFSKDIAYSVILIHVYYVHNYWASSKVSLKEANFGPKEITGFWVLYVSTLLEFAIPFFRERAKVHPGAEPKRVSVSVSVESSIRNMFSEADEGSTGPTPIEAGLVKETKPEKKIITDQLKPPKVPAEDLKTNKSEQDGKESREYRSEWRAEPQFEERAFMRANSRARSQKRVEQSQVSPDRKRQNRVEVQIRDRTKSPEKKSAMTNNFRLNESLNDEMSRSKRLGTSQLSNKPVVVESDYEDLGEFKY